MSKKNKNKKAMPAGRRGFSFMEVMISVFVLSTGIVAAMSLISSSFKETIDSKNQILASLLAQEGIEIVKSIRDNNWNSGEDTFENFPGSDNPACFVDMNSASISCSGSKKLDLDNSGFYVRNNSSGKFQRIIRVSGTSGETRTIESIVVWGDSFQGLDSFSNDPDDLCDTANKCAFARIVLSKWGEE